MVVTQREIWSGTRLIMIVMVPSKLVGGYTYNSNNQETSFLKIPTMMVKMIILI